MGKNKKPDKGVYEDWQTPIREPKEETLDEILGLSQVPVGIGKDKGQTQMR